ncbi:uncharacterized protein CDAR_424771 [Caerostris darwini]|uniref:Uncharacterized protein n=1 Tax=Caerostris darwini TaxID=1538125 RepID=A0AAV4WG30_9ARAC|nr:uncharacterized protein CDAR_424771 [Caerostris darwini]
MYRDGDYDREDDNRSTASFPEGLREEYQYMPTLDPAVRRTNSADDVARFHRYFDLVRTNCGDNVFKWRHYTRILLKELRSFRLPLLRVRSTPRSEASAYFTASEAAVSTPKSTPRRGFRKLGFSEATSSSLSVRSHLKKVSSIRPSVTEMWQQAASAKYELHNTPYDKLKPSRGHLLYPRERLFTSSIPSCHFSIE